MHDQSTLGSSRIFQVLIPPFHGKTLNPIQASLNNDVAIGYDNDSALAVITVVVILLLQPCAHGFCVFWLLLAFMNILNTNEFKKLKTSLDT